MARRTPVDDDSGAVTRFALALYRSSNVSPACLTLQDRLDVDVNLVLYAAFVGAVRAQVLTEAHLNSARGVVDEWHHEVVRPLRSVRRRLKTGPSPAPSPATMELRRELQRLEIEAEVVELGELDAVAAEHVGPHAADGAAARATAAITVVALSVSGRAPTELDAEILEAVAVIATAAAELANDTPAGEPDPR
jgi:uncharacterized protein (TIGR02444 family)